MRLLEVATTLTPVAMTARLSRRATVGALAAYLSHAEPNVAAPTLEASLPLPLSARVGEAELAGGDRLLVCVREPGTAAFPAPAAPGDRLLTLTDGAYTVRSGGKRTLLAGVPGDGRALPDVDLRRVVAAAERGYLSRATLVLRYDAGVWTAARTGQTRVLLDEVVLGASPVPLNHGSRLRFYRASDDPGRAPALGGLTVHLEWAGGGEAPPLPTGTEPVAVWLGLEAAVQTIQTTDSTPLSEVVARLAAYNGLPLTGEPTLYRLRLLPPGRRIAAVELEPGAFLYTPYTPPPSGLLLVLQDAYDPAQTFTLAPADGDALVGCRLQPNERVPALDVDLYPVFAARSVAPHQLGLRTPFLARLRYHPAENLWWLHPTERPAVGLFVNTARVGAGGVPLASGDVLTLGNSTEQYYARLTVQARADDAPEGP